MQGHKIGCPKLEHLLNFTLFYDYSLWYDVIFVDNINGVMGRENPQIKRFLGQFKKKMHTLWSIDSREIFISKIGATRCQILRLKCTKFDFRWGSPQTPLGELTALPQTP